MELNNNRYSQVCRRCGTCCVQGGPALHVEDRHLVESGTLARRDLVTIRRGEPIFDQLQNQVTPAKQEFLKLAGAGGTWSCKFYNKTGGCGMYGQRPLECRLLFCHDTAPLKEVIGKKLLNRRDFLTVEDPAMEWLDKLDREVPYQEVSELLAELDLHGCADTSLNRLSCLVRADLALRESFLRSFPKHDEDELFLLGRPLFLTIAPYGCRLFRNAGGVRLQYTRPG